MNKLVQVRQCFTGFTFSLLTVSSIANAAVISSSFDSDLDGWTNIAVNISHVNSDGNPGGYLRGVDIGGESFVVAPGKFLGDLSGFDGGSLSYDIRIFASERSIVDSLGEVRLSSGATSVMMNGIETGLLTDPSDWVSGLIPLTADQWGMEQTAWINFLTNITAIEVSLDPSTGGGGSPDIVGLDNFQVQAVPIPGAAWLFGSAMVLLAGFRRRYCLSA